MTDDLRHILRTELGDPLPEGLGALDDPELGKLAEQLRDARERQRAAVDAAIETALGHLPWFVRGPVRTILLG